MDSASSHQVANPQRLKNLACNVKFSGGNTLLHQFVLCNSDPNDSASGNRINAVLWCMSDVPAGIINALNNDGYSALDLAVLKKNLLMVKKLLSCLINVDVNRNRRGDDNTALHLAVESGHLSIIQELLDKGAHIDMESGKSRTAPLCLAVSLCDLDAVKFLVNKGANVNKFGMVNNLHAPPLIHAVILENLAIVEFLIDSGADISDDMAHFALFYTVRETENLDILKFLLDRSVNFDIKSDRGRRVLFCAVASRNLASVEILVSNGAEVNAKSVYHGVDNVTPLHYAVIYSSLEMLKILPSWKRDHINAKNGNCDNPLLLAEYSREGLEIVAFLIDQGAEIDATDGNGKTPLHFAVLHEHEECVALLLDRGADLDATDKHGMTPLHYAAKKGHVGVMRAILDKGADVNAKNKHGQTPLDTAREFEKQSCIDILQNFRQ